MFASSPDLAPPGYVETVILREPYVAVASPDHPLAGRDRITPEEFGRHRNAAASQPFMLASGGIETDVSIGQPPGIHCNDDATLRRLAVAGLATAFANRHQVQPELNSGKLVRLRLDWEMSITIVAVTTRAASHSPILREIVALAEEIGRDLADAPAAAAA